VTGSTSALLLRFAWSGTFMPMARIPEIRRGCLLGWVNRGVSTKRGGWDRPPQKGQGFLGRNCDVWRFYPARWTQDNKAPANDDEDPEPTRGIIRRTLTCSQNLIIWSDGPHFLYPGSFVVPVSVGYRYLTPTRGNSRFSRQLPFRQFASQAATVVFLV